MYSTCSTYIVSTFDNLSQVWFEKVRYKIRRSFARKLTAHKVKIQYTVIEYSRKTSQMQGTGSNVCISRGRRWEKNKKMSWIKRRREQRQQLRFEQRTSNGSQEKRKEHRSSDVTLSTNKTHVTQASASSGHRAAGAKAENTGSIHVMISSGRKRPRVLQG